MTTADVLHRIVLAHADEDDDGITDPNEEKPEEISLEEAEEEELAGEDKEKEEGGDEEE